MVFYMSVFCTCCSLCWWCFAQHFQSWNSHWSFQNQPRSSLSVTPPHHSCPWGAVCVCWRGHSLHTTPSWHCMVYADGCWYVCRPCQMVIRASRRGVLFISASQGLTWDLAHSWCSMNSYRTVINGSYLQVSTKREGGRGSWHICHNPSLSLFPFSLFSRKLYTCPWGTLSGCLAAALLDKFNSLSLSRASLSAKASQHEEQSPAADTFTQLTGDRKEWKLGVPLGKQYSDFPKLTPFLPPGPVFNYLRSLDIKCHAS